MNPLDIESLPKSPWKNGGGITRQLSIGPEGATIDAFDWRVTIADIEPGTLTFSRFAGVDRKTVFMGGGLRMGVAGSPPEHFSPVEPFMLLRLDGEQPLEAVLDGAPIQAFNVMVRREAAGSRVAVHRADAALEAGGTGQAIFYCARGQAALDFGGARIPLSEGQAIELPMRAKGAMKLTCRDPDTLVISARIQAAG